MAGPKRSRLRQVVELACRAPSVHNTQPWRWRIPDGSTIELFADRSRQLPVADAEGRNLTISCGAALQHVAEAAPAFGLASTTDLLPVPGDPDLLARVHLAPAAPVHDAAERLLTLEQRCTDRRRFTAWPVPESRLAELARAADGWGAVALPVTDVTTRFRTELLMERARVLQAADGRYAEEQAAWIRSNRLDGMPETNARPQESTRRFERANRFVGESPAPAAARAVESADGLVVIGTAGDETRDWLLAGQTLSAVWLHATRAGLSVVPLSQVVEVGETRKALHDEVLPAAGWTQVLLRIGWQEIARTTLPRTPRLPLEDVLMP